MDGSFEGETPIVAPPIVVRFSLFLVSIHFENLIHLVAAFERIKILKDLIEGDIQWRIQKILVGGGFEAQNLKNSDVFTKIESDFSAEIGNSNVFFRPNSGGLQKKKKGLHQN